MAQEDQQRKVDRILVKSLVRWLERCQHPPSSSSSFKDQDHPANDKVVLLKQLSAIKVIRSKVDCEDHDHDHLVKRLAAIEQSVRAALTRLKRSSGSQSSSPSATFSSSFDTFTPAFPTLQPSSTTILATPIMLKNELDSSDLSPMNQFSNRHYSSTPPFSSSSSPGSSTIGPSLFSSISATTSPRNMSRSRSSSRPPLSNTISSSPTSPPAVLISSPEPSVLRSRNTAFPSKSTFDPDGPASVASPGAPSPADASSSTTDSVLQHHHDLQASLTSSLSTMATQLKLNSLQFADALARDKAVMEDAQEKLGANLGTMKKEGGRLEGYKRKAGGTTCFVLMGVGAVAVLWLSIFMMIKVT